MSIDDTWRCVRGESTLLLSRIFWWRSFDGRIARHAALITGPPINHLLSQCAATSSGSLIARPGSSACRAAAAPSPNRLSGPPIAFPLTRLHIYSRTEFGFWIRRVRAPGTSRRPVSADWKSSGARRRSGFLLGIYRRPVSPQWTVNKQSIIIRICVIFSRLSELVHFTNCWLAVRSRCCRGRVRVLIWRACWNRRRSSTWNSVTGTAAASSKDLIINCYVLTNSRP